MKFFHVYNDECFEGLVKNGLINEETGFKMQNVFSVPKELQFNEFAKCGGRLHSLIKEGNYPFYVDRIAGGITYYKYDYDKKLIEEYKNILGDWFLGFQLHESASNRRVSDWKRILEITGHHGPYDKETLKKVIPLSDYAKVPGGDYLYTLSHGSPEEYAELMCPKDYNEFIKDIEWMFKRRMEETGDRILPCDSYYLFTKSQDELGMNTFMPEVGCQIAGMRIAVALSRGIASYSGKRWGTYYETWICVDGKCSMPCYNTDPRNEWYLTQETHPDDFTSFGENGGSSRYLQERIYYHSLMSGADYMAEEWGLNNSYSDMNTFDLSPYGKVKKDFINDSLKMKGMKAYTPFAVVLPMDYKCVQIANPFEKFTVGNHRIEYMKYPLQPAARDYVGHIEDVIKLIFGRNGEAYGNEGHVIANSRFGDFFDIIYEDAPDAVLSKYDYLIDATPTGAIAAKMEGRRVLKSGDLEGLSAEIERLAKDLLPVYVDSLHWLISKDGEGRRFLSIFNNEGNTRDIASGDTFAPEADAIARITFKTPANVKLVKNGLRSVTLKKENDRTYTVELPAASFVILQY